MSHARGRYPLTSVLRKQNPSLPSKTLINHLVRQLWDLLLLVLQRRYRQRLRSHRTREMEIVCHAGNVGWDEVPLVDAVLAAQKLLLLAVSALPHYVSAPNYNGKIIVAAIGRSKSQGTPESKDDDDSNDEDEDEDNEGDDEDDDGGEEEYSGDDGNENEEDDDDEGPEANGGGGSDDEDDEDDDDDDDDDDGDEDDDGDGDEDEDEEDEEEEEDALPQPPSKRRK